jgi:hypothetical protein
MPDSEYTAVASPMMPVSTTMIAASMSETSTMPKGAGQAPISITRWP